MLQVHKRCGVKLHLSERKMGIMRCLDLPGAHCGRQRRLAARPVGTDSCGGSFWSPGPCSLCCHPVSAAVRGRRQQAPVRSVLTGVAAPRQQYTSCHWLEPMLPGVWVAGVGVEGADLAITNLVVQ